MNSKVIIGLEIHAQMKTLSKVFSTAPVSFGDLPNTSTSSLDLAFPGTMPQINKQVVINAIRMAYALHMDIDYELHFERKNYFYSDLAKGFQITQQSRPIGKNGYLDITNKRLRIKELHIEEDTCKQTYFDDYLLLDYNRSGIPLLEIVSEANISNGNEAKEYIEKIRSILMFLNISDGKMEEGSLRVDVNISMEGFNRVEIKNINTIVNIQKAIDFEIDRQTKLIKNNGIIKQETRRFNEFLDVTEPMREKVDSIDYNYCPEINIPPIRLNIDFINHAIQTSPELADIKLERYKKLGLDDNNSSLILSNVDTSNYFDKLLLEGVDANLAANWMNVEVQTFLKKVKINIRAFPIRPSELATLLKLVQNHSITHKIARETFERMIETGDDPKTIIEALDLKLVDDEEIKIIVSQIIDKNPRLIMDYKNGKDRVTSYIIGKVMEITSGRVNPGLTHKIILEELKGR